jgi:hypothetical protein
MNRIQLFSFFLLCLCAVLSCKKETLPVAKGSQLKMTISKWYDSINYTSFNYDSQHRLLAQIDSNNNGHKRSVRIEYNAQDRPIKITTAYTYNNTIFLPDQSDSLIYDANGRIVKRVSLNSVININPTRNSYSYDAKGRLIADSIHSYWANEIFGYITYTYDDNDNIIQAIDYEKLFGSMEIQNIMQGFYDSKTNPYKRLGILGYIINQNDLYLSRNNRNSEKYQGGTILTFDYNYYSNGLPKRLSVKDNSDPSITYLDFFYE